MSPVAVVNSFYGALSHKAVEKGTLRTKCGATVKHGFAEDYDERTVAEYAKPGHGGKGIMCLRCFPELRPSASGGGCESGTHDPTEPCRVCDPSLTEAEHERLSCLWAVVHDKSLTEEQREVYRRRASALEWGSG